MKTLVIAAALIVPHNFTPVIPSVQKAACHPVQVCQTCVHRDPITGSETRNESCNCYMTQACY